MTIFLTENNELRPGWKFGLYVAEFLLIWIATAFSIAGFYTGTTLSEMALNVIALFIASTGAMFLTISFADHRPFRTFGLGFFPNWRRDLLLGVAWGMGLLALFVAGCYRIGYISVNWTADQVPRITLIETLGLILLAAATEELTFRGLPLQLLIDSMGEWPAIIAMSGLFGALHVKNPNASPLSVVNTVIAGILLSLAYVRTRSLWLPFGIHAGWNLSQGFILGFQLSGGHFASIWTTGIAGSDLILGGAYGPEGGLLVTFLFAASAVFAERKGRKS